MKIHLSPIASDRTTQVSLSGLTLTIDGTMYDLSEIPEGGQANGPDGSPFIGIVTRTECKIEYHYDINRALPNQSTNPEDYIVEWADGEMPSPIQWMEIQ